MKRRTSPGGRWLTGSGPLACWLGAVLLSLPAAGAEVQVAVAANFAAPLRAIGDAFHKATGHQALLVTGSTGKLYAQIQNGAPFDVLLAADEATPRKLEAAGLGVPGTRFTYALGTLVLYSKKPGYVDARGAVLRAGNFRHLAIANPKLAPYGAAAWAVLSQLGLLNAVRPTLVEGENIAQTFEFVSSGNAELGFVALSQVKAPTRGASGSYWIVPEGLYPRIRQDAVLLERGAARDAARQLLRYLQSSSAQSLIRSYGYQLDSEKSGDAKAEHTGELR